MQPPVGQPPPARQGQGDPGGVGTGCGPLQGQAEGQRSLAGGCLCHHEVLTQAIAGGAQNLREWPAVEDDGLIPQADRAGGQGQGRSTLAELFRCQPEPAPAFTDRGRFDGQSRRADLAAQGLQGGGQGRLAGGQDRRRRGLLGIGALAEFGQGNGVGGCRASGGVRRRGETAPRHEDQQGQRQQPGRGD